MTVPLDPPIFHITHVSNLAGMVRSMLIAECPARPCVDPAVEPA